MYLHAIFFFFQPIGWFTVSIVFILNGHSPLSRFRSPHLSARTSIRICSPKESRCLTGGIFPPIVHFDIVRCVVVMDVEVRVLPFSTAVSLWRNPFHFFGFPEGNRIFLIGFCSSFSARVQPAEPFHFQRFLKRSFLRTLSATFCFSSVSALWYCNPLSVRRSALIFSTRVPICVCSFSSGFLGGRVHICTLLLPVVIYDYLFFSLISIGCDRELGTLGSVHRYTWFKSEYSNLRNFFFFFYIIILGIIFPVDK